MALNNGTQTNLPLLTISAGEYANNQEKDLSEYELVPLISYSSQFLRADAELRTKAEREGCVAVVGVLETIANQKDTATFYLRGTGLRLRK